MALQEEVLITSISLSPDSRYLLAALHSHVLRLWHLDDLADRCTAGALGAADEEDDPMDTMVGGGLWGSSAVRRRRAWGGGPGVRVQCNPQCNNAHHGGWGGVLWPAQVMRLLHRRSA